jgi:uncharacterized protein
LRWTWDEGKNRANQHKHHLSFETARLAFNDPLAAARPDRYPHEERWQTIGMVGTVAVLVIHTWPDADAESGEETGRIVSARKATAHERKAYEEGEF